MCHALQGLHFPGVPTLHFQVLKGKLCLQKAIKEDSKTNFQSSHSPCSPKCHCWNTGLLTGPGRKREKSKQRGRETERRVEEREVGKEGGKKGGRG